MPIELDKENRLKGIKIGKAARSMIGEIANYQIGNALDATYISNIRISIPKDDDKYYWEVRPVDIVLPKTVPALEKVDEIFEQSIAYQVQKMTGCRTEVIEKNKTGIKDAISLKFHGSMEQMGQKIMDTIDRYYKQSSSYHKELGIEGDSFENSINHILMEATLNPSDTESLKAQLEANINMLLNADIFSFEEKELVKNSMEIHVEELNQNLFEQFGFMIEVPALESGRTR